MGGLYETETWPQILMVTGIIGGGAALLAGRAISSTWRPYWYVPAYMAMLGAGVRFLHFALYQADLLSVSSYLVDTLYLMAVSSIAYRMTLAAQMARQYPWLYERAGPLGWRERRP
ncbi:MAG: hypothetical protein K9G60_13380 [Pseudolabrys sp.]|nr:hypothetical protein [Pseudolabrys sp.]